MTGFRFRSRCDVGSRLDALTPHEKAPSGTSGTFLLFSPENIVFAKQTHVRIRDVIKVNITRSCSPGGGGPGKLRQQSGSFQEIEADMKSKKLLSGRLRREQWIQASCPGGDAPGCHQSLSMGMVTPSGAQSKVMQTRVQSPGDSTLTGNVNVKGSVK
ncbi:unnamed protein product [Pleuronectes platessa]|uniref:Uncharacterized protein n=1 Tax=Pleuronectes platessa TaxID=8262 RepID=A0A9N7YIP8_PLEPL|nr:unnamed protein product [Pleuronectes platessa]